MLQVLAILVGAIPALIFGIGLGAAAQAGLPFFGVLKGGIEAVQEWQTLIAGLIALLAAFIAVQPVWNQLAEMRAQSAVQTHEMLRALLSHLQEELRLARDIHLKAKQTLVAELMIAQGNVTGLPQLNVVASNLEQNGTDLDKMNDALARVAVGSPTDLFTRVFRSTVILRITELQSALLAMRQIAHQVKTTWSQAASGSAS